MPRPQPQPHALRHAAAARTTQVRALPGPPPEAQCRALVARLDELTEAGGQPTARDLNVDFALATLPDPNGWGGFGGLPWGHPRGGGSVSRQIQPARAGRSGYYFRCEGTLHDNLRDAFVDVRFRQPLGTHTGPSGAARYCDCVRITVARPAVAHGHVDIDAQLELLRGVLRHVALAAPAVDLNLLATDLFGGQHAFAEFYLWRLESDGFVAHAGQERLDSLMLSAEGAAVLLMLEGTRPGANSDALSARALFDASEDQSHVAGIEFITQTERPALDLPRFLSRP